MKSISSIKYVVVHLLLCTLMLTSLNCTKDEDETSSDEPEEMLDLVGTWDIDMVKTHSFRQIAQEVGELKEVPGDPLIGKQGGAFTIDRQISAKQETFVESVMIDLEHAVCLGTNFKQTFDYFAFGNVKDNKIHNAKAGDYFNIQAGTVTKSPGFDRDDLRRIDFSCDFTSFPDANGIINLPFRGNPNTSIWCEEIITFTARKRE